MRRRRQHLQVSTFPFLAVLLCAMGSLILLLLILDRRAKMMSQAQTIQVVAEADERAAKEAREAAARAAQAEAERRAAEEKQRREWEERLAALRARLAAEQNQLTAEANTIREQITQLQKQSDQQADRAREARQRLDAERRLLAQLQEDVAQRQKQLAERTGAREQTQTEMRQLAQDLDQLEQALTDIHSARKREQQTYSLVPYRGKYGDTRKPIYIECSGVGLTFHPDQESVALTSVTWYLELRRAVEKRIEKSDPDEIPYLLMLIRPAGIKNYYQALAALDDMRVDFGYEFIESEWILDFPNDDQTPTSRPPWTIAGRSGAGNGNSLSGDRQDTIAPGLERERLNDKRPGGRAGWGEDATGTGRGYTAGTGGQGQELPLSHPNSGEGTLGRPLVPVPRGIPGGSLASGVPSLPAGADTLPHQQGHLPGNSALPGSPGMADRSGNPLDNSNMAPLPTAARGIGNGGTQEGQSGTFPPTVPGTRGSSNTAGGLGDSDGMGEPSGTFPVFAPGTHAGSDPREGTSNGSLPNCPLQAGIGNNETAEGKGVRGYHSDRSDPGASEGANGTNRHPNQGDSMSSNSSAGTSWNWGNDSAGSSSGSPGPPPILPMPGLVGDGAGTPAGSGGTGCPNACGSTPQGSPSDGASAPGGTPQLSLDVSSTAASSTSGSASPSPLGGQPRKQPEPTPTLRPSRGLSDRDWVIYIECGAQELLIDPGRKRLALSELGPLRGPNNRLLQLIQEMIARKQARVPPGEPPFRPQIRFLVRPDGLRSYYRAYPALEILNIPMTRTNLDISKEHSWPGLGF
ncbi:MAG: hypothetical protein ACK4RK_14090 [Gemmataceae bacterium]